MRSLEAPGIGDAAEAALLFRKGWIVALRVTLFILRIFDDGFRTRDHPQDREPVADLDEDSANDRVDERRGKGLRKKIGHDGENDDRNREPTQEQGERHCRPHQPVYAEDRAGNVA